MTRKAALVSLLLITGLAAAVMLLAGRIALVGAFSSYQTIFAMIAQRFQDNHFHNLLRPELFMIEAGKPSLELIFYPMVSLLAAGLHAVWGGLLDFWGRFVSVTATVLTAWVLYRIAREWWDRARAAAAAFFFVFSPYVWVYGRNFQNEALALLCVGVAMLCVLKAGKRPALLAVSALGMGLAGIMRIHFLFLLPGLLLFFARGTSRNIKALWFLGCLILPFAWNLHDYYVQNHYPNVHSTMFMQLQVGKTFPHPLLLDWNYYAVFLKNLAFWAVGPIGFVFAAAQAKKRESLALLFLTILSWSAVLLIPQKFEAQHFYGYAAVLPMSLLAGAAFAPWAQTRSRHLAGMVLLLSLVCSAGIAYRPAYKVTVSDLAVLPAAEFLRENTSQNALVIASHGTSGDLLYYGRRLGWSFALMPPEGRPLSVYMHVQTAGGPSPDAIAERNAAYPDTVAWLEYLRKQGAEYFIVSERQALEANAPLRSHLQANYRAMAPSTAAFCAFDLRETSSHAP